MGQYNGILIHRNATGEYNLDVVDSGPYRSLHFDSAAIQSRILRSEPDKLVIEYTQAMMLSLAFQSEPKRILIIGLGAGAQARFLLKHYSNSFIDALEIDPHISDLAHRFFYLPIDKRLKTIHMGAAEFLISNKEQVYDIIIVDAFDSSGPVTSLFEPDILNKLSNRLSTQGVCAINTWKDDPRLYAAFCAALQKAFSRPVFDIELKEDPENTVIIIPSHTYSGKQLLSHCKHIKKQTGLNLIPYLNNLAELSIKRTK